jgi:hypothetical protein
MKKFIFVLLFFSNALFSFEADDSWAIVNTKKQNLEKFKSLINKFIELNRFRLQKQLFDGIENNDVAAVHDALKKGVDLNSLNGNGQTALMQARHKNNEFLFNLIKAYCDSGSGNIYQLL